MKTIFEETIENHKMLEAIEESDRNIKKKIKTWKLSIEPITKNKGVN